MLMIKKNGIFITIITQNAIQQNIIWNVEDIEFSWLKKYNKSLCFLLFWGEKWSRHALDRLHDSYS